VALPIILDNKILDNLRAFAEANRLSVEETDKIREGTALPPGERVGYTCHLEPIPKWKVVFTIEELRMLEGDGTAWVKHMSMSCDRPGRAPNPVCVKLVCEHLGFSDLNKCHITLKDEVVEVIETI